VTDWPAGAERLWTALEAAPAAVRAALAGFDFRAATAAVWRIVEEANRYVEAAQPWHLARAERAGDAAAGDRLDQVLGALIAACQVLAAELWPFLPDLAARVAAACSDLGGRLPAPRPVFPRIDPRSRASSVPGTAAASGTPVPAPVLRAGRQYPAVAGGQEPRPEPGRPKVSEVA
jgi:methionyl-tRNA synthetase